MLDEITKYLSFRSSLRLKYLCNHLYTNVKLKIIKSNFLTSLNSHPYIESLIFSLNQNSLGEDVLTLTDLLLLKKLHIKCGNIFIINLPLLE